MWFGAERGLKQQAKKREQPALSDSQTQTVVADSKEQRCSHAEKRDQQEASRLEAGGGEATAGARKERTAGEARQELLRAATQTAVQQRLERLTLPPWQVACGRQKSEVSVE